ncbi:MAG: M20 family metallopeptidase [Halanaeroarchaeum sp.]
MDELVALTAALVAIPSHEDETAAGEAIATWLREHTDTSVAVDDAGNVVARRGDGPSLALVGHHDVVPPADEQVEGEGFAVEERDGRLYGRGTADMKGAVAAMLLAFRDADPPGELVFASFAGEEDGGVGARAAIEDGFAPDFAVVGEGSTGYSAAGVTDVAIAHKGRRGSTLVAGGESAHASEPGAGVNAVYRAADAVDVVRDLAAPSATVFGEPMTGSLAVTGIEGGEAWNVIPDECTVTVDERTVPGDRAALARTEDVDGVEWRVDQDLPPMRCDDPEFADAVQAAADEHQDGDPQQVRKPHATDAGWLADAGTTCLVCGPAEPGEAHTDDESVAIDALHRLRRIYEAVANDWPGHVD